jgi:hypothetical protein
MVSQGIGAHKWKGGRVSLDVCQLAPESEHGLMQRSMLIITNTKSDIIVKRLFFDVLDFGSNSHRTHPRLLPCLGIGLAVDPLPWGLISEEIADDQVDRLPEDKETRPYRVIHAPLIKARLTY